ncbi:hypothetical protein HCO21_004413 [Salmonella enterica]|nr:hypothetical protein [Salmonella enterica]
MTKILTTAEHNQATADLATLTAIVENYAVTHPKKHGWSTLGAFWGQFGYRKLLYVKVIFYTPGLR